MPDTQPIIDLIRAHHRRRIFAMEQRKRANLALGAFLRSQLGWSLAIPEDERERIEARAAALQAIGDAVAKEAARFEKALTKPPRANSPPPKLREVEGAADPDYVEWADLILGAVAARAPFDQVEDRATKAMEKLAIELPVYPWCKTIDGLGARNLATIVGEAGDIGSYANPAKLWKRMGLAVIDGVRQGGLGKNAPKEAWTAHGYNRARRSRMWNVGGPLLRGESRYRELFLERCATEHVKALAEGLTPATTQVGTVESWSSRGLPPLTRITATELKKNAANYRTAGHMARRAQRYVEKRLLRDLWRAWRAADSATTISVEPLPADLSPGTVEEVPQPDIGVSPAGREAVPAMASRTAAPRAHPSSNSAEQSAERETIGAPSPRQCVSPAPIKDAAE